MTIHDSTRSVQQARGMNLHSSQHGFYENFRTCFAVPRKLSLAMAESWSLCNRHLACGQPAPLPDAMHQGRASYTVMVSENLATILFQESLFKTRNNSRLADSIWNSSKLQFAALQIQWSPLELLRASTTTTKNMRKTCQAK